MKARSLFVLIASCSLFPTLAATAQHTHERFASAATPTTIAEFVSQAREATRRYQDRRAAIADGYRRLGPEFPGMGEHWVNLGPLVSARFDVAAPPVLTYATIAGHSTLVGVAYALPLLAGETPPSFPSPTAWHDHTGTIDDEVAHLARMDGNEETSRIAMLHAWVWLENPDGVFAAENWALPYARVGLSAPEQPDSIAAKALSLAAGGNRHYVGVFRRVTRAEAADSLVIENAVQGARQAVLGLLQLGGATSERLRAVWQDLEGQLAGSLSENARARLIAIHSHR